VALRELRLSGALLAGDDVYIFYQRQVFAYVSVSQQFSASACVECDVLHALGCSRSRYDGISMMAVTTRTAYYDVAN
jgi:hypothetical protein